MDDPFADIRKKREAPGQSLLKRKQLRNNYEKLVMGVLQQLQRAAYPNYKLGQSGGGDPTGNGLLQIPTIIPTTLIVNKESLCNCNSMIMTNPKDSGVDAVALTIPLKRVYLVRN